MAGAYGVHTVTGGCQLQPKSLQDLSTSNLSHCAERVSYAKKQWATETCIIVMLSLLNPTDTACGQVFKRSMGMPRLNSHLGLNHSRAGRAGASVDVAVHPSRASVPET
jgi:hypothetical protein